MTIYYSSNQNLPCDFYTLRIFSFQTQSKQSALQIGCHFSAVGMEYLLDLEMVGSKIGIFGEKKGVLSIVIEHQNTV